MTLFPWSCSSISSWWNNNIKNITASRNHLDLITNIMQMNRWYDWNVCVIHGTVSNSSFFSDSDWKISFQDYGYCNILPIDCIVRSQAKLRHFNIHICHTLKIKCFFLFVFLQWFQGIPKIIFFVSVNNISVIEWTFLYYKETSFGSWNHHCQSTSALLRGLDCPVRCYFEKMTGWLCIITYKNILAHYSIWSVIMLIWFSCCLLVVVVLLHLKEKPNSVALQYVTI